MLNWCISITWWAWGFVGYCTDVWIQRNLNMSVCQWASRGNEDLVLTLSAKCFVVVVAYLRSDWSISSLCQPSLCQRPLLLVRPALHNTLVLGARCLFWDPPLSEQPKMCLGTWGQVATQPKRAAGEEAQLEMGFKCCPMHEAPALQKT